MNIDQQLRAALSQEAEMQNAPEPDVDRLISGGRLRQRRRNLARVGAAAAVAVLVAGGVYGVVKASSGTDAGPAKPPSPTQSPQPYPHDAGSLQPGTYRMLVGNGVTGVAIDADLTLDSSDWQNSNYPLVSDGTSYGAVAIYQPLALAAGTGCLNDRVNDSLGHTPQAVARQLTRLPGSTVVQAPTPVQAFGRDALHLQSRITPDCGKGVYRVAMTLHSGHGISYGEPVKPVVIDFWVLDVRGTPVVVDTWHQVGSSSQLVDEIARTRDSISIVTGG
jgi:hypothetical protein